MTRDVKVLVDADACPVVDIIERIAREKELNVVLLCDTNHMLQSDYCEVKLIDAGADAVDFALINLCSKGDIVVTQDYGVAAMALGKGAYGIHQSGKWYTNENIDQLLQDRHIVKQLRRSSGRHRLKRTPKRTHKEDQRFEESFYELVQRVLK